MSDNVKELTLPLSPSSITTEQSALFDVENIVDGSVALAEQSELDQNVCTAAVTAAGGGGGGAESPQRIESQYSKHIDTFPRQRQQTIQGNYYRSISYQFDTEH